MNRQPIVLRAFLLVVAAALIVSSLAPRLAAQTPFEEIHGDVLRRIEAGRAVAALERRPLLMPDPTPTQLQFDALHYTIDIGINPATQLVEGSVTMLLESLVNGLATVDLDMDDVLTVTSVDRVSGEPTALPWLRSTDLLAIQLEPPLALGEQIEIEVAYLGYPATAPNTGLFFRDYSGTPVVYSLSEPWGARTWWPCKDYPDDKALFDIFFSVPASLFAASNGTYLGYTEEIRWTLPYRRYGWHVSYPMTTYLASIAASDYVRLDDYFVYAPAETMPVTHYVYPSRVAYCTESFNITVPALEFFSSIFGLYPFVEEKYGKALTNLGGGMEHQTLCSYGYWFANGSHSYDWLFVHELAHQWFGDCITCEDWTHIWLNEGFASYAEALWFEHLQGATKLRTYMEGKDTPWEWDGPILRDPENTDPWYYFNGVVYDKAAWLLHMLRHVAGDAAFFEILPAYMADPRYRHSFAETEDFIEICEDRYGASLDWFFDEWLTRVDRLSYQWSWNIAPAGALIDLTVVVDQLQADPYMMPVDLRVTVPGGALDTVLWIDEQHEEFLIALAGPVIDVALDPDHWILCDKTKLTTGGEPAPLATFLDQNVPNPFNPSTTIRFGLREPGRVTLHVFDVRGGLVATLADDYFTAGPHEITWNGTVEGNAAASGLYLYRLRTPHKVFTKKMVLIR